MSTTPTNAWRFVCADGVHRYLSCPRCGAVIHENFTGQHDESHDFFERERERLRVLADAVGTQRVADSGSEKK